LHRGIWQNLPRKKGGPANKQHAITHPQLVYKIPYLLLSRRETIIVLSSLLHLLLIQPQQLMQDGFVPGMEF